MKCIAVGRETDVDNYRMEIRYVGWLLTSGGTREVSLEETPAPTGTRWELARPEDRSRWWIRDQLYTVIPRTPLSNSVFTPQWDEAIICVGDELKFPDSRGFNVRTVNGYTYLSPMKITDATVISRAAGPVSTPICRG